MAPGNRLEFLVHAPAPGAKLYLDSEQVIVGCAGDGSAAPVALIPYQMDGSTPNITVHLNGQSQVTEEWTLQNYTNEVHAFHIHQIHFRVMTDVADGQPLMDVIDVPAAVQERNGYPGAPGQVTIRLTFTSELAGEFVYHCHILEHEDNGMMGKILVSQD
jgi:FtsP/CotA-like multicopper oxidase with cupredoxin domain